MGFKELRVEFDKLSDDQLCSVDPAKNVLCEQRFRYWLLRLMFEINGNMDSLAVAYRELVKLQKERTK